MWTKYDLVFELIEPLLGTIPKDKNVFENFIMDQAKTEVEKKKATEDLARVPCHLLKYKIKWAVFSHAQDYDSTFICVTRRAAVWHRRIDFLLNTAASKH